MSTRSPMVVVGGFLVAALSVLGTLEATQFKDSPKDKPLPDKDVLVVTPAQWRADFKKDSAAAKAKCKGKTIEMSGVVDSARPDPFGGPYGFINLEVTDDFVGVRCVLADPKPWKKVSPGSKVKVRGKSSDVLSGDLNPCTIIEASPNPCVVITAADLAKQYTADRQVTAKKYEEKWAMVKGEVIDRPKTDLCAVLVKLKGAGDITLECCFGEAYKRTTEKVVVGSKVDIYGRIWFDSSPKAKAIGMSICVVSDVE
jgi:tRNA_anti-like